MLTQTDISQAVLTYSVPWPEILCTTVALSDATVFCLFAFWVVLVGFVCVCFGVCFVLVFYDDRIN